MPGLWFGMGRDLDIADKITCEKPEQDGILIILCKHIQAYKAGLDILAMHLR